MSNSRTELCGACCKGSLPIRKSFCESIVCACGAPFFSQIVVENNLPGSRRCLIEIPMEFMEDHGSRFDKTVTLQNLEDSGFHRVKIGGNLFVGFGFEWRDFAQSHNIGIGQVIVFTLVARSRFLVQIYELGNGTSFTATKPQTPAKVYVEQARTVPLPVTPKVEDDDDIVVCKAQDWLVAKASRIETANPILPSKVKEEKVCSESSSGLAIRTPDKHAFVVAKKRQKCGLFSMKDSARMDVSDGIVEASDSSRRKNGFDSEIIREGQSVRATTRGALRYESRVLETAAEDCGGQSSPHESSSQSDENRYSETSTSDSAWSPGKSHSRRGRKTRAAKYTDAYSDSNTEDENEDEEDGEDEDEDGEGEVHGLNGVTVEKLSSAAAADGSSPVDVVKRKRGRPRSTGTKTVSDRASADGKRNGNRTALLVEGYIAKTRNHDWHVAGTKRGRTYVSKRRPVTESERIKTLERARQVQIQHPSFLKQLHKDSCYRSLKLFPPTSFYRDNMVPATKKSYKATLIDEEGKSWPTNIQGMKIFWKHFTLDHYLEEDDVVVFELIDPRVESVTFRVHIFRVVDVKVTLTGKVGWAIHFDVVEGTKKQYFEERRRLLRSLQNRELKKKQKLQRQKQKQKEKSKEGSNPEIDSEFSGFFKGKKKQRPAVTEVYKRLSNSQRKIRELQQESKQLASNSSHLEEEPRTPWRRPTTRNLSREVNRCSGDINATSPSKSLGSVKQEIEDTQPLAPAGTGTGNLTGIAVNSVNAEPSIFEEEFRVSSEKT